MINKVLVRVFRAAAIMAAAAMPMTNVCRRIYTQRDARRATGQY